MPRFGWQVLAVIFVAFSTAACGDSTKEESSSEHVVLDTGGFTLILGPADPAIVPEAAGKTCPGPGTFTIGNPPPTATAPGGLVEDFAGGAGIFCVVAPEGDTFYVDVSAAVHANTADGLSLQILVDGVDPTLGTTAASAVVVTPTNGILTERPSDTCSLAPIRELSPGVIYADFECPLLAELMGAAAGCAASGTIEFRQCDAKLDGN